MKDIVNLDKLDEFVGKFSERLANDKPVIIALEGDLGSGKTTFGQKLGYLLGVKEPVISPTFIIHREYKTNVPDRIFHHLDLYRLNSKNEFDELEFSSLLRDKNMVIVEWADKFKDEINSLGDNARLIWIKFGHVTENERSVEVT